MQALSGEQLSDGQTFTIDGNAYEFDMGLELDLPNAAGDVLANEDLAGTPETFTITTNTGSTTFEFDRDGHVAAGNTAIPVSAGETTSEVAAQIAKVVNGKNLKNASGKAITADPYESRVMFNGATGVAQSPTPSIALVGNGSGIAGGVLVPISSTYTAAQVAQAIVAAVDPTLAVNGSLIHLVGHVPSVDLNTGLVGPMPYSAVLTGDNPSNPTYPFDRFDSYGRGLGQRPRGLLHRQRDDRLCGARPDGHQRSSQHHRFHVPHRRGGAAGFEGNPERRLLPTSDSLRSRLRLLARPAEWQPRLGARDRHQRPAQRLLLADIPSANDIAQGQTFTVSDGVTSVTFQFVDQNISTGTSGDDVPIYFASGQTAAVVAANVATAINDLNMSGVFKVSAATNGSAFVSLFGAANVSGLLADTKGETKVTVPPGSQITNGSTLSINDGTHVVVVQFVDSNVGVSTGGTKPVYYSPSDTAATIAGNLVKLINGLYARESDHRDQPMPIRSIPAWRS